MIIDHTRLRNFAHRIVAAGGSSPEEAASVADHLIEANLRGHDSHGVGMLVAYVRDFEAGTLKVNQTPEIVSDSAPTWSAIARSACLSAVEVGDSLLGAQGRQSVPRVGSP